MLLSGILKISKTVICNTQKDAAVQPLMFISFRGPATKSKRTTALRPYIQL